MKALAAAVGAVVLGTGATWYATRPSDEAPGATRSFWSYVTPHASEVDPPRDVAEAAKRSDAIVLAHVVGVTEGREDKACAEVAVTATCSIPKTVFVQLAVDRAVRGSVKPQQVLNLEMFRPPKPLTLDTARDAMPPGELLFFLGAADSGAASNVWGVISLSRGVIAQGPQGLYTALDPEQPADFVRSFRAATVEEAADAAAAAA
jgi:hypothetical protein